MVLTTRCKTTRLAAGIDEVRWPVRERVCRMDQAVMSRLADELTGMS